MTSYPGICKSICMLAVAGAGTFMAIGAAGATTITLPGSAATSSPDAVASVTGQSTDGAAFTQSSTSVTTATASGSDSTAGGSFVLGSSLASFVPAPPSTQILAGAAAAPGATAATFSAAKLIETVAFASAGPAGSLVITTDPVMSDAGNALSTITFEAMLNGTPFYYASATLNSLGDLTTMGSFSAADFLVTTTASGSSAELVAATFDVPINISPAQAGRLLTFEFDESYYASSQDGGLSIVAASIPEPMPLALLGTATVVLMLGRSRRLPSSAPAA